MANGLVVIDVPTRGMFLTMVAEASCMIHETPVMDTTVTETAAEYMDSEYEAVAYVVDGFPTPLGPELDRVHALMASLNEPTA